jgi:hypothetical protein
MKRTNALKLSPNGITLQAAPLRAPDAPTDFDLEVKRLRLTGSAMEVLGASVGLREWAMRWCRSRYIPEDLLKMWGMEQNDL